MRASLLAAAAVAALCGFAPAYAADLPVAAPAESAVELPPVYNWNGFYAGVHGGYGTANFNEEGELFSDDEIGPELDGFVVGGLLGYNFQVGNYLLGVEADGSYVDLEGEVEDLGSGNSMEASLDFLATFRVRAGYSFGRVMAYATGGLAIGDYEADFGGLTVSSEDNDDALAGYTVGVGVEGFLTDKLTARIEYLFHNFSDDQFDMVASLEGVSSDLELHTHVVRGALTYRFTGL